MKTPEALERQVSRIHDLLERSHDVVTWNDHMPDPDNATQLRQIDITVRAMTSSQSSNAVYHETDKTLSGSKS